MLTFPVEVEVMHTDTKSNLIVKSILDFVQNRRPEDLLTTVPINLIPKGLRDVSPSSYDSQVVSIGPLHRDNQNVVYFEELKAYYLYQLLHGLDSPPEQTLKECVEKVLTSMDRIRACYGDTDIGDYDDVGLAKMMVVDACFIIQFITMAFPNRLGNLFRGTAIAYDLVLVENQIPFFVLQQVFDCTMPKSPHQISSLVDLIFNFVRLLNIFDTSMAFAKSPPSPPYDHILGFMAQCYRPSNYEDPAFFSLPRSGIHSTIELGRAGVNFKPNENDEWQMAMKFTSSSSSWSLHKPTLRMPVLRIDNYTELALRNLIAYEQYFGSGTYVTSYAMAMDMLVDSEEDIAKLTESGVIVNHLGSNHKAANVLNSLCKEIPVLDFCYYHEWQAMDAHCNRYWPKNIADLKRTYFSSPWNLIALLAGIVLFTLTIVQTLYTVKAA